MKKFLLIAALALGLCPNARALLLLNLSGTSSSSGNSSTSVSTGSFQGLYYSTSNLQAANYTITSTDTVLLASGAVTITLPAATQTGHLLYIEKIDLSTQPVTINPSGTDTIAGSTQIYLNAPYESLNLIDGGSGTWVVQGWDGNAPYIGSISDSNTNQNYNANAEVDCGVYVPVPIAVQGLAFRVTTTSNTGHTDVGVRDQFGNLLRAAGSTANQASAAQVLEPLSSPLYLLPGIYYLCLATDNSTVHFEVTSNVEGFANYSFTSSFPLSGTKNYASATVGGSCPKLVGYLYGKGVPTK